VVAPRIIDYSKAKLNVKVKLRV